MQISRLEKDCSDLKSSTEKLNDLNNSVKLLEDQKQDLTSKLTNQASEIAEKDKEISSLKDQLSS